MTYDTHKIYRTLILSYLGEESPPWSPGSFHGMTMSRFVHVRFLVRMFFLILPSLDVVLLQFGPSFPSLEDTLKLLSID